MYKQLIGVSVLPYHIYADMCLTPILLPSLARELVSCIMSSVGVIAQYRFIHLMAFYWSTLIQLDNWIRLRKEHLSYVANNNRWLSHDNICWTG